MQRGSCCMEALPKVGTTLPGAEQSRAGFLELCANCFQYLEMGQLSPLPPQSRAEGLPVSCQDSILEPLPKFRNAQSSPGQKFTELFCVWSWRRRERAVVQAPGSAVVLDTNIGRGVPSLPHSPGGCHS